MVIPSPAGRASAAATGEDDSVYGIREPAAEPAPVPSTLPPVVDTPRVPPKSAPRASRVRRLPERLVVATSQSSRGVFYVLFVVTMVPLAIMLLWQQDDFEARLERTLEAHPEIASKMLEEEPDVESVFSLLPGRRIEGAHLPRGSMVHWVYAIASSVVFLGAACFLFDLGNAKHQEMLWVALATATFGIVFLLLVQLIAQLTSDWVIVGGNIFVVFFYLFKFIGFSYSAAMNPETGFWLSFMGFLFGVGLCEEFTKALPLVFHYRGKATLGWRGACFWGLASGIGFGIAEGVMYSSDFYNGVATGDTYLVRFVSCVALHAVWSASAAIMIWRRRDWFEDEWDWGNMAVAVFWVLGVPIVLHALYDTLLKKEMNGWALAAALGSFAWLVFLTEWTRSREAELA